MLNSAITHSKNHKLTIKVILVLIALAALVYSVFSGFKLSKSYYYLVAIFLLWSHIFPYINQKTIFIVGGIFGADNKSINSILRFVIFCGGLYGYFLCLYLFVK